MKKRILTLASVLALVAVLAMPMAALATVGSVTITGGSLSEVPQNISLLISGGASQLTGADLVATANATANPWTATDPTGSGAGWHLNISSTDFTSDDVQKVYLAGTITGTFTLTYSANTTAPIAGSANAATVETAVEALDNVTAATVTGAGTEASPWVIRFVTDSGSGIMTANVTSLGGGTATITLATIDISVADQQFGITLTDANVAVVTGNIQPASSVTGGQDIADATVSFLAAPTDTGMGSYTLAPSFTLEVRAETYAGAYTATVTVAIVAGP